MQTRKPDGPRPAQPRVRIAFDDPTLFGSDAADFEDEGLFRSYALSRAELGRLTEPTQPIQVVRAYKGEGKSALLRLTKLKLDEDNPGAIVIHTIGPDLSPAFDTTESESWARGWKKSILRLVACELGSRIGVAYTDDAITLVEEAEANGFKQRSLLSAIIDRLVPSVAGVERKRLAAADYENLIRRHRDSGNRIWILIDDVDQNFATNEKQKAKIAGFFTACRQIIASVPEIRFRLCVRPNVWAIVKREFESLSHIEQYVFDLEWKEEDFRSLLAQRVGAYLFRTGQLAAIAPSLPQNPELKNRALIEYAFEGSMPWGGRDRRRPPHVVLYTLARHRPRWMIELCKFASSTTHQRGGSKIGFDDVEKNLDAFGKKRIEDLIAEFRSQCDQVEEILAAFAHQNHIYTTAELVGLIRNRVLQAVRPRIAGVVGPASEVDIAHFLFQIGFITGRRETSAESYEHIAFAESPTLLKARTNIDDGLKWEVHPVFRAPLNIGFRSYKASRHG